MIHGKIVNYSINISIYMAILGVGYGPFSVWVAIAMLCVLYLFLVLKFRNMVILFPFYMYPFMFIIRARNPENLLLAILPEIFVLISMVFHYTKINFNEKIGSYSLLLFFYAVITSLIIMFNIGNIYYFPLMFRQYIIPVLFTIYILDVSSKRSLLPFYALKISFNSFAIVAALSILNILGIFRIDASMEALYPVLNYSLQVSSEQAGRSLFGSDIFLRLNLFCGGALGSSAAIFIALGLSPYLSKKLEMNSLHRLASVFLLAAGAMTFSSSIIIPIVLFIFLFFGFKNSWFINVFIFLFCMLILGNLTLFVSDSIFNYVYSTTILGFSSYLLSIDLWTFLFGSGPRFTSSGFEFVPNNFIIDVGVLRVFIETGALNFIIFSLFIISILRKGFFVGGKLDAQGGRVFFFIFLVFLLMVHANMTAIPPFFPLFSVVVAGIVRAYYYKIEKRAFPLSLSSE